MYGITLYAKMTVTILRSQDELETTKRSYEEQLRTLSDHLCGMNEKLTSQKDQIDELKITGSGSQKPSKFHIPGRKK